MSRRDQIRMSEEEVRAFVAGAHTVILCSNGRDGHPHPMPMWFAVEEDGSVVMSTFARSQKIQNLTRDPQVALLFEDGEAYGELRGVVMYGKAELLRDTDRVLDVLARVTAKTTAGIEDSPALRESLRRTAAKRVAIRLAPQRVVSWDHRKLGGAY